MSATLFTPTSYLLISPLRAVEDISASFLGEIGADFLGHDILPSLRSDM